MSATTFAIVAGFFDALAKFTAIDTICMAFTRKVRTNVLAVLAVLAFGHFDSHKRSLRNSLNIVGMQLDIGKLIVRLFGDITFDVQRLRLGIHRFNAFGIKSLKTLVA